MQRTKFLMVWLCFLFYIWLCLIFVLICAFQGLSNSSETLQHAALLTPVHATTSPLFSKIYTGSLSLNVLTSKSSYSTIKPYLTRPSLFSRPSTEPGEMVPFLLLSPPCGTHSHLTFVIVLTCHLLNPCSKHISSAPLLMFNYVFLYTSTFTHRPVFFLHSTPFIYLFVWYIFKFVN